MVMQVLSALDKKVVRDLRGMWGQAVAIALVIAAGVAMFVMSEGMLRSLVETREAYYERYGFADVFAPLKRAPNTLSKRVERIAGIRFAETRISKRIMLDMVDFTEPVQGQVLSYPVRTQPRLNRLHLVQGRWLSPGKPDEVLLSEPFLKAHAGKMGAGLKVGDKIKAILNGRARHLKIVGTVLSPEFIYAIQPSAMMPDNKRYGIVWMSRSALEAAFNMNGAFNDVVMSLDPSANVETVKTEVDKALELYGGIGAYGREHQVSDWYVSGEMEQLRNMAKIVPPIFFAIAAFLLNVVITRWVDLERERIGLLKAFGYATRAVAIHYIKLVMIITVTGLFLGFLGGIWLGRGLAVMYQEFFQFPFLHFQFAAYIFAGIGAATIVVALLSTASAVRRAAILPPSEAMSPPPPTSYKRSYFERWIERLSQPSRMIVRHLVRWPTRTTFTILGNASAVAVLIGAMFFIDAMDKLIDINFNRAERQDATLNFLEAKQPRVLDTIKSMPSVMHVEPVRSVAVKLSFQGKERRTALTGIIADARLSRVLDQDYNPVSVPPTGLVLSAKLSQLLGAGVGDVVIANVTEGRRPVLELPVVQVSQTMLGSPAFMDFHYLGKLMREQGWMNGVHVKLDPQHRQAFYTKLNETPGIAAITMKDAMLSSFRDTMAENIMVMTVFNVLIAGVIAMGVIYNAARISLSERARELASLRVLGFTLGEVSYILLGELAILTLLALPIGCALGYGLAWIWTSSLDTDLYRLPLVVSRQTYGYAVLVVVVTAILSGFAIFRQIGQQDIVKALKTRE